MQLTFKNYKKLKFYDSHDNFYIFMYIGDRLDSNTLDFSKNIFSKMKHGNSSYN